MRGLAIAAAAAVLSGCAHRAAAPETIVVLPQADGRTGTVVVQRGEERHVLDQPYATSRPGQPVARLSEAEVRESFGPALAALPARPASFTLYFVTGTDELTPQSKAELQNILAAIMQRPVPDVVAIGHTDTVGELANNDRLSAQRAERVKTFLVDIGIPASRIQTAGRGERELLIPTGDNVDEPRNRRVEINVR
jgi:outer membrane protein OmpA-like peptidoglycan-associated protein